MRKIENSTTKIIKYSTYFTSILLVLCTFFGTVETASPPIQHFTLSLAKPETCTICQETIIGRARTTFPCEHSFHTGCAWRLIEDNDGSQGSTCPNCRSAVEIVPYPGQTIKEMGTKIIALEEQIDDLAQEVANTHQTNKLALLNSLANTNTEFPVLRAACTGILHSIFTEVKQNQRTSREISKIVRNTCSIYNTKESSLLCDQCTLCDNHFGNHCKPDPHACCALSKTLCTHCRNKMQECNLSCSLCPSGKALSQIMGDIYDCIEENSSLMHDKRLSESCIKHFSGYCNEENNSTPLTSFSQLFPSAPHSPVASITSTTPGFGSPSRPHHGVNDNVITHPTAVRQLFIPENPSITHILHTWNVQEHNTFTKQERNRILLAIASSWIQRYEKHTLRLVPAFFVAHRMRTGTQYEEKPHYLLEGNQIQ